MRDREPTIRRREMGEGMHRAMKQAGLDQQGAARLLGWSQGRVSRLLSGKRGGTEVDVSAFLAVCQVTGDERDRPDRVLVRDSKDRDGPALTVPTPAWQAFLTTLTR